MVLNVQIALIKEKMKRRNDVVKQSTTARSDRYRLKL